MITVHRKPKAEIDPEVKDSIDSCISKIRHHTREAEASYVKPEGALTQGDHKSQQTIGSHSYRIRYSIL